MIKLLFYTMSTFLTMGSCNKGVLAVYPVPGKELHVNTTSGLVVTRPVLSGSFIDFWGKGDWTQQQWNDQLQEMKVIGLTTVIVQFTAYDGGDGQSYSWFNSKNTFTATKYPNALTRLMSAAAAKNMSVYIGLYFSNDYWQNQTNVPWLNIHADRCNSIATEIKAQFGNNAAFKGWFIPHEPEPYAYNTAVLVNSLKVNLIDRISNHLHTLNSKPVAIAAFFNSSLSSSNNLLYFMAELGKSNLQIIMLQDGVGVNHVSLANLGQYYNDAKWGLFNEGTFAGEFWSDVETFNADNSPASMPRLSSQLSTGASYVTKLVSFQYFNDMSLSGPNGILANQLKFDYINYKNSVP